MEMALKNPYLDNSLPESWAASYGHGTPGALNDVYIDINDQNQATIPVGHILYQNYPNPFNAQTVIEFTLPNSGQVVIIIFDILGRELNTLVSQKFSSGKYRVIWDGKDQHGHPVGSGIYFYLLKTDGHIDYRKMMIIR
jgi:hypothetical protein